MPETRVELVGGIGNQLFGYYAGLYFQEKFGTSLSLDFNRIRNTGHPDSDIRFFELFPHRQIENPNFNSQILRTKRRIRDKALIELPALGRILYPRTSLVIDSGTLGENLSVGKMKILLRGYFGNFDYYETLKARIPKLKVANPSNTLEKLTQESDYLKPIMVHIRGGDYLTHSKIYGTLPPSYYLKAIEIARLKVGNRPIWVYTDDMKLANSIFSQLAIKVRFIDDEFDLNPAEALYLQSTGSANITANSTFSSWAAALNIQSDVKICPAKFFIDGRTTPHWPPLNWQAIGPGW
jgi:hypothetical protein